MSDIQLDTYLHYGTAAQRAAFVPDPPIIGGVAVQVLYEWRETDTGNVYVYDTAWHQIAGPGLALPAHHTTHETGGSDALTALSGAVITSGTVAAARLPPRLGALGIIIDGAGTAITTGLKAFPTVPFACTITGWTLLSTDPASTVGSIVIDLWKAPYASYPPVVGNTITGSALPTLSSAKAATSATLTGWTTAINAGDVLAVNVNSATTVTRVSLTLAIQA